MAYAIYSVEGDRVVWLTGNGWDTNLSIATEFESDAHAREVQKGIGLRSYVVELTQGNMVCWNNCGTSAEVAALVADVAAVSVKKLPVRNPFPPGPFYRAFEIARGAALLALGDDYGFRLEAEQWLRS